MKRILFLVLLGVQVVALGQHARETFGTNRIQYKDFKWAYITSENFDVYYYDSRKNVATEVANFLESEFDRITDLIGYPPYLKTKVFLYNSIADLKQSNMGLNRNPYIMGGETEFVQPYVEIAHPGTLLEFKEELLLKVADLMVNEMMFGGSLKDMFQQSVLLNLPEWFTRGASLYVAKGWDSEMDDFARQLVRSRKANRATSLSGREAALAGQSIWNYIVEKYGKSSLSNILNYSRVIRNEQRSVLITLGVPLRQLMSDWKQFYLSAEQKVSSDYVFPADSNKLSPPHKKTAVYTTMKVSPDGRYFAYAENDRGKYVVRVKSLENDREMTILNGGLKVLNQAVDYRTPLLNWADDHTLGVIGEEKGSYVFWLYDLNTRSKLPRELDKFNNIRSFDFSQNGRLIVLSAEQDGQNDLFLLSSRRDRVRRLTNDIFDDLDPSFIPNTNSVVFSSNRTIDTVNVKRGNIKEIRTQDYNLFIFDLDSTGNVVERLTNSIGKDYYPYAYDANTFYYLSDQRGITNLFKYDKQTKIYTQVTNFASGIKEYDLEFGTGTFAMVATKRLSDDIFVFKNFDRNRQTFTPATKRQDSQQAKQLIERRKASNQNMSLKELINQRLKEANPDTVKTDTVANKPLQKVDSVKSNPNEVNTDSYSFEDAPPARIPKADTVKTKPVDLPAGQAGKKAVNTADYVFEDEAVQKLNQPSESFLNRYIKNNAATRINGPFPYQPKFSWDNVVANIVIDPLRGWSMKGETQMNDMLENFRLVGGIQVSMNDWKSGDVYVEAQYLPKRIDYGLRFDRKTIYWISDPDRQEKYTLQKLEYIVSLPLLTRVRASVKPFAAFTRFVDRGAETPTMPGGPTFNPSQQQFYAGVKGELVFDNSVTTGLNIIEGTRGKISFTNYQGLKNANQSFSHLVVDFRHYQKIYKEIVLAFRGFGGSFMGRSPKQYALGGMDNWIGNRSNYDGIGNPLVRTSGFNSGLIFLEYATSLRGFDYATFYGTSALVGNAELRVPLIRAFSSGPIASNFFRNMQFTAFYDIGTSWSGKPSFTGERSVRSRIVGGPTSPFEIKIDEYLNPWLYSYGFGFRSMIFGYYTKVDFAWPVENYTVKDPRIHITFGFDF